MAPLEPISRPQNTNEPPPFPGTASIDVMHNSPRFGHSSDITVLVNEDQNKKDYLMGVVSLCILVLVIYLVWALVIIILRILGRKRVGFLAGCAPIRPAKPPAAEQEERKESLKQEEDHQEEKVEPVSDPGEQRVAREQAAENEDRAAEQSEPDSIQEQTEPNHITEAELAHGIASNGGEGPSAGPDNSKHQQAIDEWKKGCRRFDRTVFWSRFLLVLSGIAIIICSIIFMAKGYRSLENTVDEIHVVTAQAHDIAGDGIVLLDDFLNIQTNVLDGAEYSFNTLSLALCPSLRQELCDLAVEGGTIDPSTCDLTNIPFAQEVEEFLQVLNVTQFLNTAQWVLNRELRNVQSDLIEIQERAKDIDYTLYRFDWAFYLALGFAIVLDLLVVLILVGVALAWRNRLPVWFKRARRYFIVPALMILIALVIIFTIVFLAGGTVGADYCTDPDRTTTSFIVNLQDVFSTIVHDMLLFWVNRCRDPPIFFEEHQRYLVFLRDLLVKVHDFADIIGDLAAANDEICGTNATLVAAATDVIDAQLHLIFRTANEILAFFFCDNFFPLYRSGVYQAMCTHGVDAMRWTFGTLCGMTVCTMIMITLRGAWFNTEGGIIQEEHERGNEGAGMPLNDQDALSKDEDLDEGDADSKLDEHVITGVDKEPDEHHSS